MNDIVPEGWKSVKLDEVAEERSDRVDNPSKSGYDRFVGLDHLDSGELTVRRWGSTADLLSAMKLFKNGDILIGRRNAYLKRASKAEFDGVCSGDAYVVREKKGKIAEGLLPIILNSDSFWDYTIAHASGTMSKRAKWRDLAEYTFLLPSPEEQRRIATTLWATEDCIVKGERFVAAAERAKQVLMLEFFSGRKTKRTKPWKNVEFSTVVASYKNGIYKTPEFYGKGLPSIRMFNILEGKINKINSPLLEVTADELKEYQLLKGDILINRVNSIDLVGKAGIVAQDLGEVTFESKNIRVRVNQELIIPEFLIFYLQTKEYSRHIRRKNKSAIGQATINQTDLADLDVPLPPLPEQRQIAGILTRCDETIAAARVNVMAAKALKMKMINEMLGPHTNEVQND